MRYFQLLVLLITAASPAYAQKNFSLDGVIKGKEDGVIYLKYASKNGEYKNDSALIKGGQFHLEGRTSEPAIAFLTTAKNKLPDNDDRIISANGKNSVVFFLEPSVMAVSLDAADFQSAGFTGGQAQTELSAFNDQAKAANAVTEFIDQHPDSYVSAWLLTWHHYPLDTLRHFYNSFNRRVQSGACGRAVLENIHKKESVSVGRQAPAFGQKDRNGNKVGLNNFRGKYVLLQFWSSTNSVSKAENQQLLQTYEKYKDKNFAIIGASLDGQKTRKVWSSAVESLPWTQLAPLKAKDNPVAIRYDVETIPTNFLIDPSGRIIATDLYGQALERTLEETYRATRLPG